MKREQAPRMKELPRQKSVARTKPHQHRNQHQNVFANTIESEQRVFSSSVVRMTHGLATVLSTCYLEV